MLSESNYPTSLWVEYSTTSLRTTNSCEAFNFKFNVMFLDEHYCSSEHFSVYWFSKEVINWYLY